MLDNWHIFEYIFGTVTGLINGATGPMLDSALAWIRRPMYLAVVLWIGITGIMISQGMATLGDLWKGLFRAAIVIAILENATQYHQWLMDVALALPTEIGNAISNGGGADITSGRAFDTVWQRAGKAGLIAYDRLPSFAMKSVALGVFIIFYLMAALACIGATAVWLLLFSVWLSLLLAIGPIFFVLFVTGWTAPFARGWVQSVVGAIIAQVLLVAVLGLLVGTGAVTFDRILTGTSAASANVADDLLTLLAGFVLILMIAGLIWQVPSFSSRMSGGAYVGMSQPLLAAGGQIQRAIGSAGNAIGRGVRGIGGGGGAGGGGGGGMRSNGMASPGRSISAARR